MTRWELEAWDGKFLRYLGEQPSRKAAILEAGTWKNCTHFILNKDGEPWERWGLPRYKAEAKEAR